MVFQVIVSCKSTHHHIYLLLLLTTLPTHSLLLLQNISFYYELFPSYAFIESHVVNFHQSELHGHFLRAVIIIELHFRKQ